MRFITEDTDQTLTLLMLHISLPTTLAWRILLIGKEKSGSHIAYVLLCLFHIHFFMPGPLHDSMCHFILNIYSQNYYFYY